MKVKNITRSLVLMGLSVNAVGDNTYNDRVAAMSETERSELFLSLFSRNGTACKSISKTFYQGSNLQNTAFWNVSCGSDGDWIIGIGTEGGAQTFDCETGFRLAMGVPCFTEK